MVLLLMDSKAGLQVEDEAILAKLPEALPHIQVYNKIDLVDLPAGRDTSLNNLRINISAKTGAGLCELKLALLDLAGWHQTDEGVFMARERHLNALSSAAVYLKEAHAHWQEVEIFAEMLSMAQRALSEITGEFSADDLLGEIFSRFCIGK
jgi:tRNA modification GTPase